MQSTTTPYVYPPGFMFPVRPQPDTFLTQKVAIICGCLLIALTAVLFTSIGLVLRFMKVKDGPGKSVMMGKRGAGEAAFYEGLNPQSAQQLVGSMSTQSFGSSPSLVQLNAHGGGSTYYNKGFEVDQGVEGGAHAPAVHYQREGVAKQIDLKRSKKNTSTA